MADIKTRDLVPHSIRQLDRAVLSRIRRTLQKMHGQDWHDADMLSLAGIYVPSGGRVKLPASLDRYLEKHPHTGEIVTHLDRDFAGSKMTEALRECLQGRYKFTDAPPDLRKRYK